MAPLGAFLLLVCVQSFVLGRAPLSAHEGRHAYPALLMARTGDLAVPRLGDEPFLAEPPLHCWMMAGTHRLLGSSAEWVWRLPSVLSAGLLAALLAFVAGRWFGRRGGWIAGTSLLFLVALWGPTRTADSSCVSIFMGVAATLALIELGCGDRTFRPLLTLLGGLAIGGVLLTSGPPGLCLVVGGLIGPAIALRKPSLLARPPIWVAVVVGVSLYASWWPALHSAFGDAADGGSPLGSRPILSPGRWPEALWTALRLVFYALPLSPLLLLVPKISRIRRPSAVTRLRAVVAAMALGAVLHVLAGTTDPRDAYSLLPMLCIAAGAAIDSRWYRRGVLALSFLVPVLAVSAAAWAWRSSGLQIFIAAVAVLSPLFGAVALAGGHQRSRVSRYAILVALFALLTVPLADREIQKAMRSSAIEAADVVRNKVGDRRLRVGGMLREHADLCFYADVRVESVGATLGTPHDLGDSGWVLFTAEEWSGWGGEWRARFVEVVDLALHGVRSVLSRHD